MDSQAVTVRLGERVGIYETVATSSGTVTINSATFDFLDNSNASIASGVLATGNDAPGASARAWYQLDTAAPPGGGGALLAGNYRVKWTINVAVSGDTLSRVERPSVLICVVA